MKENEIPQSDLISLTTIQKAVLDFFKYLFRSLDFLADAIKRNILLIIFTCLFGLGLGFLYYSLKPKSFISEMIVVPNELTRRDFNAIISNLDKQLSSGNYQDLNGSFDLDKQEIQKIHSVKALSMDGNSLEKDTSSKVQPFRIQVGGDATMHVSGIQQAVLGYLNNNPFLKQIKDGQRLVYLEKLDYIEKEQKKLDSLKTSYNAALVTMSVPSVSYNNALNPADIYVQSNNLANQKEAIQNWFHTRSTAVMLVDGMKTPKKEGLPLVLTLSAGFLAGLFLGLIISLLASIRQIINSKI